MATPYHGVGVIEEGAKPWAAHGVHQLDSKTLLWRQALGLPNDYFGSPASVLPNWSPKRAPHPPSTPVVGGFAKDTLTLQSSGWPANAPPPADVVVPAAPAAPAAAAAPPAPVAAPVAPALDTAAIAAAAVIAGAAIQAAAPTPEAPAESPAEVVAPTTDASPASPESAVAVDSQVPILPPFEAFPGAVLAAPFGYPLTNQSYLPATAIYGGFGAPVMATVSHPGSLSGFQAGPAFLPGYAPVTSFGAYPGIPAYGAPAFSAWPGF